MARIDPKKKERFAELEVPSDVHWQAITLACRILVELRQRSGSAGRALGSAAWRSGGVQGPVSALARLDESATRLGDSPASLGFAGSSHCEGNRGKVVQIRSEASQTPDDLADCRRSRQRLSSR
jgi:hypothetical protein